MSIFSKFFGSKKVVENVFDSNNGLLTQFGGWIGNMNLTEEELLKSNTNTVSNVSAFVVSTLSESTERSKARRAISIMWFKLQASLILMTAITIPFKGEWATAYYDLATSTIMLTTTSAITIFFFGSHGLAKYQENKKSKASE
jgi:hypothetical protein